VLLVPHDFLPHNYGGVEVYTFNLAKELMALGCAVAVLHPVVDPAARGCSLRAGAFQGITVYELVSPPGAAPDTLVHPEKEGVFRALLEARPFDVVHFQHTFHGLPMSLVRAARAGGTKVALTLHDFWFICPRTHLYLADEHRVCSGPESVEKCGQCLAPRGGPPDPARDGLYRRFVATRQALARELLGEVDLLTAPSRFVAEIFARHGHGAGRIEVAPLGIPPGAALPRRPSAAPVIGYLGTIQPLKNVFELVEAFSAVSGDARLLLHGHGPEDALRKLAARATDPRISFCGRYTPGDLPRILSGLDVVVVPSLVESYCFTVREALSAGVPVIASAVGGIPDAVKHGENGLLFDPSAKGELAAVLQAVVDHPRALEPLRAAAARTATWTIARDAAGWLDRYRRLRGGEAEGPLREPSERVPEGREAFLYEPDFARAEWEGVLLAYLSAFEPADPVALLLPLDPARPGHLSLEAAAERVLQVVGRCGKEAVPELVLLDRPEELLERLREFARARWIAGDGKVDGPDGRRSPLGPHLYSGFSRMVPSRPDPCES